MLARGDLVAFISSAVASVSAPTPTDFVLTPSHPDFPATGLKVSSTFKLAKLLSLHQSLVLRKLGRVTPVVQRDIDARLARAIGVA